MTAASIDDLPALALSVRQPWAWAIIHAGKDVENRSAGSIRDGRMRRGRICIHAASAMTRKEYEWGLWRLDRHGVRLPEPHRLVRGAIIGTVEVVDIVSQSESEWFGGPCGLVLRNPQPIEPIPARGELGYFRWHVADEAAPALAWMMRHSRPADLFPEASVSFREPPAKPFGTGSRDQVNQRRSR